MTFLRTEITSTSTFCVGYSFLNHFVVFRVAAILYEKLAEMGFEVAQSNAAWMYDRGLISVGEYLE
jgi:hypothetical protein